MEIGALIKTGFGTALKSKPLILLLFAFGFIWNIINIPLTGQIQEGNESLSRDSRTRKAPREVALVTIILGLGELVEVRARRSRWHSCVVGEHLVNGPGI